jgi:hypothetical protein
MMNAINHDQEINKVIMIGRNIEARNNDECQEPGCAKGTKKKKTLIMNKGLQLGDQQGDHGKEE